MSKIHYGELLSTEIKDKGYSKQKIREHLKIGQTAFDARLVDGEFTITQIEKLQELRYLPTT